MLLCLNSLSTWELSPVTSADGRLQLNMVALIGRPLLKLSANMRSGVSFLTLLRLAYFTSSFHLEIVARTPPRSREVVALAGLVLTPYAHFLLKSSKQSFHIVINV